MIDYRKLLLFTPSILCAANDTCYILKTNNGEWSHIFFFIKLQFTRAAYHCKKLSNSENYYFFFFSVTSFHFSWSEIPVNM